MLRTDLALVLVCVTALPAAGHAQAFFTGGTTLPFAAPPGTSNRDLTLNAAETLAVFASDRPGGPGGFDLWYATRPSPGAAWSAPRLLPVNSPADDVDPGLSANGRELYFASDRAGGPGGLSIYRATTAGPPGGFRPAVLVPGINDAFDATGPQPTTDGRRLFFASTRTGGGDLYWTGRSGLGAPWGTPTALPAAVNDARAAEDDPAPEAGGGIVWFSSARAGGAGGLDVHVTWFDARTGTWAAPLAVGELNTAGDDDGMFVSGVSGLTYFNSPSGFELEIECVCRQGPVGTNLGASNGWVLGDVSPAWSTPLRFVTGVDWRLGGTASLSFYDWKTAGAIAFYVPVVSPARLPVPFVPPIVTFGAVEVDPAVMLVLPPTAARPSGYARLDFAVPDVPSLRGRSWWSQAFGVVPGAGLEMTLPQRITFR